MKKINLQGMTTAERLKYLEEITQEIYNHLYDDYIWVYDGAYVNNDATYSATHLNGYQDNLDLKTGQIVYFSESGVVCLIDQINDVANTFTVQSNYSIKGDKGDKGEQGEQGEKGEQGETGKIALEYSSIVTLIKTPSMGESLSISLVNCNRTPVAGDKVSIFATDSTANKIYILGLSVVNIGASVVNTTIDGIIDFTSVLPDSAKKQLYAHYIEFSYDKANGSNNAIIWARFNWIDTNPSIITSEYQNTLGDFIEEFINRVGSAYTSYDITVETIDGSTLSNNSYCVIGSYYVDGNDLKVKGRIPTNGIIGFKLVEFANTIPDCKLTISRNNAYAVGSYGASTLVLYSDENGVLLDDESLSERFTKLVAAGSNESKILDSINKARSLK